MPQKENVTVPIRIRNGELAVNETVRFCIQKNGLEENNIGHFYIQKKLHAASVKRTNAR